MSMDSKPVDELDSNFERSAGEYVTTPVVSRHRRQGLVWSAWLIWTATRLSDDQRGMRGTGRHV